MKLAKRSLAIILTLLLLCGLFPFGAFATSDELETDTGQEEIEEESPTNAEPYTLDLAELVEEAASGGGETDTTEDAEADETIGAILLDNTTTIEFAEIDEATREEAFAEVMTEITDAATEENDEAAENESEAAEPDEELLESETEATLFLSLKDPGCAVCIQTDDSTAKTVNLYYLSDNDGQFYSLAPDDEAVEIYVDTDEAGRGIVPIQLGAAVHIEAIGGYGHVIAATSLVSAEDESIQESSSCIYDFTMTEDLTLTVETEEVGVNIPDEDAVVGIQVMEKNGEFINDPMLAPLIGKAQADVERLTVELQNAEAEVKRCEKTAEQEMKEYRQLQTWADLYQSCTFEAKKMIVSRFIKSIYVYSDYRLEIEFNVSFEDFQRLAVEPETAEKSPLPSESISA